MEKWSFVCLLVSFVAISQVSALRCWRCSSDISNGKFCEDPFNVTLMTENQRKWSYVDCVLPTVGIPSHQVSQARPVCKRIIQQVKEKLVFARACSWEIEGVESDACKFAATPPDVKTLYCETCRTNGCNGDNERAIPSLVPTTTAAPDNGAVSGVVASGFMMMVVGLVTSLF